MLGLPSSRASQHFPHRPQPCPTGQEGKGGHRPVVHIHLLQQVAGEVSEGVELDSKQFLHPLPDEETGCRIKLFLTVTCLSLLALCAYVWGDRRVQAKSFSEAGITVARVASSAKPSWANLNRDKVMFTAVNLVLERW